MATNEDEVNAVRVFTMFIAIKNAELKNVRTLERDNKDMVKLIANFIEKKAKEDGTIGEDKE